MPEATSLLVTSHFSADASYANPLARTTPLTFTHRICIVDSFSLWKPSVEAFLNQPGRTFATGMDVARSVGRSYATMTRDDWATLAAVVIACGWRKAKVDGVSVWQRAPVGAGAGKRRAALKATEYHTTINDKAEDRASFLQNSPAT
jgi:hypothetical protein